MTTDPLVEAIQTALTAVGQIEKQAAAEAIARVLRKEYGKVKSNGGERAELEAQVVYWKRQAGLWKDRAYIFAGTQAAPLYDELMKAFKKYDDLAERYLAEVGKEAEQ